MTEVQSKTIRGQQVKYGVNISTSSFKSKLEK